MSEFCAGSCQPSVRSACRRFYLPLRSSAAYTGPLRPTACLPATLQVRGVGPDIDVQIPTDPRQRFVIDAMAFYVMRDGCEFEQVGRQGGRLCELYAGMLGAAWANVEACLVREHDLPAGRPAAGLVPLQRQALHHFVAHTLPTSPHASMPTGGDGEGAVQPRVQLPV